MTSHTCNLTVDGPRQLRGCACGQWWMQASGQVLTLLTVAPALRERSRRYQSEIRHGDYPDLASAVRAASALRTIEQRAERYRLRALCISRQEIRARRDRRALALARRTLLDGRPCAYCGGAATQLDHILARSRGGSSSLHNMNPSCGPCNAEKGNRTPAEWKAWRLNMGRTWPPAREAA